MRPLSLALALAFTLSGLAGCAQTRCAVDQGKQQACRLLHQGKVQTTSLVNQGKRQVDSLACRFQTCQPCAAPAQTCGQQPECVCWAEPIYPNHCGGDNGIGRGGTGAFRIP